MNDAKMFAWIAGLEAFELSEVEDDDGTVFWEATADDIFVGHGETSREAIAACLTEWRARRFTNSTISDMANRIGAAITGKRRRPWGN